MFKRWRIFNVPLANCKWASPHSSRYLGWKFEVSEFPMTQPSDLYHRRNNQQGGDEGDIQSFDDHEGFECIQVSKFMLNSRTTGLYISRVCHNPLAISKQTFSFFFKLSTNNELNANTEALNHCKEAVLQPYLRLITLVCCVTWIVSDNVVTPLWQYGGTAFWKKIFI